MLKSWKPKSKGLNLKNDRPELIEPASASIYPSVEEINLLPEKFRRYIHDLETRCDKSGDVQTTALLREDRDALQIRVEELEGEMNRLRCSHA